MAGNPAESMVGLGAIGAGVLLVYASFKNVSVKDIFKKGVQASGTTTVWHDAPATGGGGGTAKASPSSYTVPVPLPNPPPGYVGPNFQYV